MKSAPLVSIISTFKDSKKMLRITAESVLSQDYPCIEHIIVDSVSTDGSVELLREYEARYAARGFKYTWGKTPLHTHHSLASARSTLSTVSASASLCISAICEPICTVAAYVLL